MEVHQEIGKWGNSLGLRIPSTLADSLGIQQGDDVSIAIEDNALIITPSKEASLEDQLEAFDMQAACKQYDNCDPIPDDIKDFITMDSVGREVL